MTNDKVYVVTASGMDVSDYTSELATCVSLHKTRAGARKKFLLFIEEYYTKEVLDEIREEYPGDFAKMLESEFYESGYEAWSDEYDKEVQENADFQLNTVSIQVLNVEE